MKDIMARLTIAEKDLISKIRDFDIFSFKEVLSDIEHLNIVNKVTNKDINSNNIENFLKILMPVLKEREKIAMKKLYKNKDTKPELIVKKLNDDIDNNSDKNPNNNNNQDDLLNKFKSRNFRNYIK